LNDILYMAPLSTINFKTSPLSRNSAPKQAQQDIKMKSLRWDSRTCLSLSELKELGIDTKNIRGSNDSSHNHFNNNYSSQGKIFSEGTERTLSEVIMQKPSTALSSKYIPDSRDEQQTQTAYIRDMTEIGKIEGFNVTTIDSPLLTEGNHYMKGPWNKFIMEKTNPWLEDYNLVCDNGSFMSNYNHPILIQELNEYSCNCEINQAEKLNNQINPNSFNINKSCAKKVIVNGGNVLTTLNNEGKTKVLVNEYYLLGIVSKTEGADINEVKEFIAEQLGVDIGDVIYLNLPEQHIDMFLRPGFAGSLFINDFKLSNTVIDNILSTPKFLNVYINDNMKNLCKTFVSVSSI